MFSLLGWHQRFVKHLCVLPRSVKLRLRFPQCLNQGEIQITKNNGNPASQRKIIKLFIRQLIRLHILPRAPPQIQA